MAKLRDLSGKRFGRLVVEREDRAASIGAHVYWQCVCDCGQTKSIRGQSLRMGRSTSCGCFRAEVTTELGRGKRTHGHARPGQVTTEYAIWRGIIARCENPKSRAFRNYGGRGIRICKRWRDSFECFLTDVGCRPSLEFSIDRIDNDGSYEPGNVRWATRSEQEHNKRPKADS